MKGSVLVAVISAIFLTLLAVPASAQATRTWVSGVGDDANPCSRTAPCKTFAGAIAKTATGGEINVLDPGGFGAVTITKSITISSESFEGGVLVSGTNGIVVSTPTGSTVTLRGLDFEGLGTGINGVLFNGAGVLHVQKVTIRHFINSGINFAPSTTGAQMTVDNATITDNPSSAGNAGILVRATGGANANVTISNSSISNDLNGIFVDGSGGGGSVNVNVTTSVVTNNTNNGVTVNGGSITATVSNSLMSYNGGSGAAVGSGLLAIGNDTVTNNVTGVANGGGTLQTFKNNQIVNNGTNTSGTLTTVTLQ